MNQTLRRHLKKAFGLTPEALEGLLQESAANAAPLSNEAILASGIGTLLSRIDDSYGQFERDLELKSRSLEISSDEMIDANARLATELQLQTQMVEAMRQACAELSEDGRVADMSSVEQASLTLRRAAERHRKAMDEISVLQRALDQHAIVSATDARGDIIFVNDNFCEVSGYSRDELIGQNHRIINSGTQPKAFFEDLWATITSGAVWRGVICNRNKRGDHYWVQATIVPVLNADGVIERYIAARTDITARIRAEGVIQRHSDLIEALFESIPLPVFVKDEKLRYVRGNDAFFDNTALGREAMIGKRWDELHLPTAEIMSNREEEELLATGQSTAYETAFTLKDGKQVDLQITKAAIKGPDGKPTGLVGVVVDLTEIKQAGRQLMAAKSAAESANRLKSDFLANMSHEIRTPMNGLIGMADLALNMAVDPNQREYLQIAKNSALSLLQIINDILDFSKIEAGKLAIEQIDFDMAQLLGEALRPMAVTADEKGLELVLDINDGFPALVRSDPGRIRQILLNLVSNAIKFTMQGEVVVRASARLEGPTAHVDLSVLDTGVGIDAASLPTLFDPFTQEDSTITRRFGGTGLGLSITRRLSQAMGGSVTVASEAGKGSHFSCLIPMAWSAADPTPQNSPDRPLLGRRIAVVDDNPRSAVILARQLASLGAECEAFTDPRKALGSIGARPGEFAAAIVDLAMPELDGLTLCQALTQKMGPQAPLLLLASASAPSSALQMKQAGIQAHLLKPWTLPDLHSIVAAIFKTVTVSPEHRDDGLVQVARVPAQEASSVSGIEVLLVEDNLVNQKLAQTWLSRWGINCTIAENGAVALERLSERPFDLVLMDCQMPVMDGFEASARIRAEENPDIRAIPIIAMTANAMAGDRERCLAAGMDDYISKPISTTYLKEAIERLARKREQFGAPLITEFDYAQALQRADSDTITIIAESFIESMEADFTRMATALSVLDWPEVMRLSHSAKGLCLTFHADPLADDFARLSTMARHGGIDAQPAQAILDGARAAWPAFASALMTRLRTLTTGQQLPA
jgi:PAS domain S-box-containing protein